MKIENKEEILDIIIELNRVTALLEAYFDITENFYSADETDGISAGLLAFQSRHITEALIYTVNEKIHNTKVALMEEIEEL